MKFLRFVPTLLLIIASVALIMAAQTSAQPADPPADDEQTQQDNDSDGPTGTSNDADDSEVEGIAVGDTAKEEFYFWDIEKDEETEEDEVVLFGAGGLYNERVKFERDEIDMGENFESYGTRAEEGDEVLEINGWLPIRVLELEYDEGDAENCGLDNTIPLHNADNSDHFNNFIINVTREDYGGTAYLDLIGDRKEGGNDSFIISWYALIDDENGNHIINVPYDLVDGPMVFTAHTRYDYMTPYVAETGKEPKRDFPYELEDGNTIHNPFSTAQWTFNYYKCEFSFADNFNITLDRYNIHSLDHSSLAGKILGQPGMKFSEWVRRADNMREYLAIEKSAREVTLDQCNRIGAAQINRCQTVLSKDFHKCYLRAIGYPSGGAMYDFENIRNYDDKGNLDFEWFKLSELELETWMHSIRVNSDAFISCFGYGTAAGELIDTDLESLGEPSFFSTNEEARQFAERIIMGTQWPPSINPLIPGESDVLDAEKPTKCSLGKMGWALCPVMEIMAKIADTLFGFLEGWMQIPPLRGTTDQAAFQAWTYLRDFGNILFTILLLGIVIIQVTGGTLSGYTVRKKVPHIAVTALLINMSFILCSIAVDISNILGHSILTTIHSFSTPRVDVDGFANWQAIVASVAFAGAAAVGTAAVLVSLAALVPMLITTVFSMVIALVLLLLRQAVVIVLIVISPLAIATRLLPGTEQWFKRWKSLLLQMLMLYPAIALVFGGAHFASSIVMASAVQQGSMQGAILAIFGLALQVIPLFVTPIVLKLGGSALNSAGGMIRGKMSGAQKATIGQANTMTEEMGAHRDARAAQNGGGVLGMRRRRKMRKNAKRAYRQEEIKRAQSRGVADSGAGRFIAGVAGGGLNDARRDRIQAALAGEAAKLEQEEFRAAQLLVDKDADINSAANADDANLVRLSKIFDDKNVGSGERVAHIRETVGTQDIASIDKIVEQIDQLTASERDELAKALQSNRIGDGAMHYDHPDAIEAIRNGEKGSVSVRTLHKAAAARGDHQNVAKAARQSGQTIQSMQTYGGYSEQQISQFQSAHNQAAQDSQYSQHMNSAIKQQVREMQ